MAWIYLIVAGLLEIVWALGMKASEGFTRLWPTVIMMLALITSFGLLTLAVKQLPIGTAYAVWTGIGAVGVAVVGIVFYEEPRDAVRLVSIAMVVLGIAGLKIWG